MTDHVETFVTTLERAEPSVAGIGTGAAHQQRESLAAALPSLTFRRSTDAFDGNLARGLERAY